MVYMPAQIYFSMIELRLPMMSFFHSCVITLRLPPRYSTINQGTFMTRILISLLVLMSGMVHAENVLHVKAGKTVELAADQSVLSYDRLILEDDAVLRIPAQLKQLQLEAAWVEIGNNVKILAQGEDGVSGAAGENREGQAEECKAGKRGGDGEHGTPGGEAVSLVMALGIVKLGSLTVNSRGGSGGNGGAGGQGQQGGPFDKCNAQPGGDGGAGGDGGDGGNGGQVSITYRLVPGNTVSQPVNKLVVIQNGGGQGGEPGPAGQGGEGTEGKYINMRTLTGNRKWMGGGDTGQPGNVGKPGRDGVKGQALVQQDLRDRMDAVIQTQSAQVAALKDQLVAKLAEEKRQVEDAAKQAISSLELQVTALQSNMDTAASQTTVDQSITDIQSKMAQQSKRLDELSAKLEQSMQDMQSQLKALSKQMDSLDARVNSSSASAGNQ